MNTALGLLIAATQLLAIVSANPSLPESFRQHAIEVANHAISVAQSETVPHISNPYTGYSPNGDKQIHLTVTGATAVSVVCVNRDYAGEIPPRLVDEKTAVQNDTATVRILNSVWNGTVLKCRANYGTLDASVFTYAGTGHDFEVVSP